MAFFVDVTDSLQLCPQNKYITNRYYDIINGKINKDNRTGDEIAADTIKKIKLKVGDN